MVLDAAYAVVLEDLLEDDELDILLAPGRRSWGRRSASATIGPAAARAGPRTTTTLTRSRTRTSSPLSTDGDRPGRVLAGPRG